MDPIIALPLMARQPVTPALAQLRASESAIAIGDAIHDAETALGRVSARIAPAQRALYAGRGAVALNLGDVEQLDRALENTAVRLRLLYPELAVSMEAARALATAAIATWLTQMSGERRR